MPQFCSCCETLATLSFLKKFPFIFKHSLFELWTKSVFSKYLYSAYLDGLCFPLGLFGAFVGIIKLKLVIDPTSCYQSTLTKSKPWCSTSLSFQKTVKSLEVQLASCLHYAHTCIQRIAEIHSARWWLQNVTDLGTVCFSCALLLWEQWYRFLGRKLFSDVICR